MSDLKKIYLITFLRAVATGAIGVLLAIYLYKLGFDPLQIGFAVSLGLGSTALVTMVATFFSHYFQRRFFLSIISFFSAVGGMCLALTHNHDLVLLAITFGMVNGMGRDRGALVVIETALLPSMTTDHERTKVFAWYSVCQDMGHAIGGLLAGLPSFLAFLQIAGGIYAYQITVYLYAIILAVTSLLYLTLSTKVESDRKIKKLNISETSKKILLKISFLFGIDSIGGGFLSSALMAFFFYERFGISASSLGFLFCSARILNAFSHLGAAFLAKRIGLVNTMVFTHIPASIFLMTVVIAPNFPVAVILFLLREALVEMDVPTRQSYVMAVIKPEERTFASGVTHIVRMGGWAIAPAIAGFFMHKMSLGMPLFVGALMKISYDVILYFSFRKLKPPEEEMVSL
ncbi:MAG: MFS transporter [Bdellovibrio sp.]|nr:MFS transporter [Bdellovibrio sp.]